MMKTITDKEVKTEIIPCEICGYPVVHNEYGLYEDCKKCGWRRGCDNREMEDWHGISYPMLVSLSHAREQYRQGLPFKADFEEFIRGLFFYSEMQFNYKGEIYEVFLYGNHTVEAYKIVFSCERFKQEYSTENEFSEKANIDGKRIKDIWDEVENPRYI
ncbi:MAG: hypothetical protein K2N22_03480 [Clostridia bacterium]|nr:hypothetical protein [Clostridia bacterium]